MTTVDEAFELARSYGVEVRLNAAGDGLNLEIEADREPDPDLLDAIAGCKAEILAKFREERRRIVQWINANFSSSSPDVCRHCGRGPRPGDALSVSIAATIPASSTKNRAGRLGKRPGRPGPGAR